MQWLKHHHRVMLHRERMAAIEKGLKLPPLENEAKRSTWNVQRLLLLAGGIWLALGIGAFVTLAAVLPIEDAPRGLQWLALIPLGIGIAHLITYFVGIRSEADPR
jgi:hypothetical protein